MQLDSRPWSLALGDGNNGPSTAGFSNGQGIQGILSKAKVPIGCLRVAVSAPVHSQHPMVRTQALGQRRENRLLVTPTRQAQEDGFALARVLVVDSYAV
jgi:hypothetical protein